jgi:hypothetical protein
MERQINGELYLTFAGSKGEKEYPFPSVNGLSIPRIPMSNYEEDHQEVMEILMTPSELFPSTPTTMNMEDLSRTSSKKTGMDEVQMGRSSNSTLYRKKGKRYVPVTEGETIQMALQQLKNQGLVELAMALEVKIMEALFSKTAEQVLDEL